MILSTRTADRVAALLLVTHGEQNFTVFILSFSLPRYSEGTGSVIQERGDREDVYTRAGEAPDDRVSWGKHKCFYIPPGEHPGRAGSAILFY